MTDQKKVLVFKNTHRLYYFDHILQREVEGAHNELKNYEKIYGNCTSIKGDVKNIYGNCSGVSGIFSQELKGCITSMYGDVTGVEGDLDLIERDRKIMKESDINGYSHYRIQDYTVVEDQNDETNSEILASIFSKKNEIIKKSNEVIDKLNELLDNSHKRESYQIKVIYSLLAVWVVTFILLLLK